jgi:hypothetical protein
MCKEFDQAALLHENTPTGRAGSKKNSENWYLEHARLSLNRDELLRASLALAIDICENNAKRTTNMHQKPSYW